jgi:hypothetical protein
VVNLEAERVRFLAYFLENPDKKQLDWNVRFGAWVAKDYQETLEKREQNKDYDDDMGIPRRQRKVSIVDTMTDEDRARERAAVNKRYGL